MAHKVALVLGRYVPALDAVAQGTLRLGQELARQGVRPTIYTARGAALEEPNSAVGLVGALDAWRLAALPSLAVALVRSGADVVHVQYSPSSYGHSRAICLLPPMLRSAGIPTVVTVHEYGGWDFELPPAPHGLLRQIARFGEHRALWDRETLTLVAQSDLTFVTNPLHHGLLTSRLPSRAGRIRIIPIGPNVAAAPTSSEAERAATRASRGIAPSAPVVAFFGFIHPVKGVETLLRAFATLRKAHGDARLLLIGGFESLALPDAEAAAYRREVEERVGALGLGEAVSITGYVPEYEVSRLLLAADLACMPFNHGVTTKSGALLAALGHGLPTVVTRADPAEPELVDGRTALVVEPKDPDGLARAMRALVERLELREALRAGAREVAARHGWEEIGRVLRDAYAEVARRREAWTSGSRPGRPSRRA